MKNQAAVLKKLRELNGLSIKEAAKLFNCSVGWLCGVENESLKCKITEEELQRLLSLYAYEKHSDNIRQWLSMRTIETARLEVSAFDGAVLRHLRKKSGRTLVETARILDCSVGDVAKLELGYRKIHKSKRDILMVALGYSSNTFNNYTSKERLGETVPAEYRLKIILRKLDEKKMNSVLEFAKALLRGE